MDTTNIVGGITSSSVLIDLNISMWTGRKKDKSNTTKIVDDNAAAANAALVTKRLFVDNPKLEAVNTQAGAIRNYIPSVTLPWAGNLKLLPVAMYMDVTSTLTDMKFEFDKRVADFLNDYQTQVSSMAFKLGALFDRNDYPTASEIAEKFKVSWDILPLPSSGDFRVDAENLLRKELQEAYEAAMEDKLREANRLLWDRLKDCLDRMADRLGTNADGKPNVFRDSLVDNAIELTGLLKTLNVTKDPQLEAARKALENAMLGVTAVDLRKEESVRESVKQDVADILKKFSFS